VGREGPGEPVREFKVRKVLDAILDAGVTAGIRRREWALSKARRIRELLEPVSKILFLTTATITWGGFIIAVVSLLATFV
jgi:hypothetical protein